MRNQKIIVINGFQRGGTNILYNIFQSHPLVCSPINLELGQIISQNYRLAPYPKMKLIRFLIKRIKLKFYSFLNTKTVLDTFLIRILGNALDLLLYSYKKKEFNNPFNKYKYKNKSYTKDEIKNRILCVKSVHNDIRLTRFLSRFYSDIYIIGLIRNGYALCESWIRRGKTAKFSGKRYRKFCMMMINDSQEIDNYKIITFEDLISNPFEIATELYKFAGLKPFTLDKLRFQVKKVLTSKGEHKIIFGRERAKYWFDSENISDLLNSNINKIQIEKLSKNEKQNFEKEAKVILKYFNYLKN
ncbi:MAG: hypothetical protein GF353_18525 [Candidatus Lokiarchaeota archaeon]|nr:hypothetical protein [Candidatus Lokiarchaeota archaeon]